MSYLFLSVYLFYFFFFKQKTAYEMRISDGVQTCALPISTKGERYSNTLPVPSVVAKGASLSGATAVVLDDLNIFTWLGYDVRPLHDTDSVYIGRFPPGFTASIMQKLLAARPTNRD